MAIQFSPELRDRVLAGEITVTVRLWSRAQAKEGGRYAVGDGFIHVDAIQGVPFAAIDETDVRLAGESDREALRQRAAHAGPITEETIVQRIEFHVIDPAGVDPAH